jgi:hypothetical protein
MRSRQDRLREVDYDRFLAVFTSLTRTKSCGEVMAAKKTGQEILAGEADLLERFDAFFTNAQAAHASVTGKTGGC